MCNHEIINNNQFPESNKIDGDTSYEIINPLTDEEVFLDGYMWNKIYKRDFLIKFDIYCLERCWGEDSHFCINTYLHARKFIHLKNFKGYIYNIRDAEGDSSSTNSFTEMDFERFLEGFYKIIDLLKKYGNQDLINLLMKKEYVVMISYFTRLNAENDSKIKILKNIYDFQQYCSFEGDLKEKWANIILKNIKNRKFKRALYFSNFLNKLYTSYALRKIYRTFLKKIN